MNTEASPPKGQTILLVEDEKPVRKLVSIILQRAGYRVLEASGANEATALWNQNSAAIDLLIADVNIPELSGPELARKFLSAKPELKVIFSTGDARAFTDDAANPTALKQFLQKPYSPDKLLETVRIVLQS